MKTLARFSAALVATACTFATYTALAADVPVSDSAREHFKTGVAFLQDPDGARYEEAYREFKAAYQDSPSWKILGNLGLSAMKLERDGEAVEAYEKYLKEGGDQIEKNERAQVERDLATTKAGLVWVTIQANPAGAYFVDERAPSAGGLVTNRYEASNGPLRIGIRSGAHKITAKLEGYADSAWQFQAVPGQEQKHAFELQPPEQAGTPGAAAPATAGGGTAAGPQMERPVPVPVYITAGLTGALLIGSGVTGVLALSKKSDFDKANDGTDPANAQSIKDSGTTLNLITDVLLGGAVVAGAVTAVLYLNRPEVPAEQDTASIRLTPLVGPSGGALSVTGAF